MNGLFCAIEQMICHLYGMPEEVEVNNVRYKRFCKNKTPEPRQLPPTKDELLQLVKCTNYQSYIWKEALVRDLEISPPAGHQWRDR